jgi:hypothetical protein
VVQAMVMTSFLVACAALVLTTIHLRRAGGEDLDGPLALLPAPPSPILPGAAASIASTEASAPADTPLRISEIAPSRTPPAVAPPEAGTPVIETPLPVALPVPQAARLAARRGRNNGFARFASPAPTTSRQTTA